MRLYLDDDSVSALLSRFLRQAGHDVQLPADVNMAGRKDPVHLAHAIRQDRVLLTRNHDDFEKLHELILEARGHHPGIFVVWYDNDPTRDLKPRGTVVAISKLLTAGVPLVDSLYVLNQWR